MCQVIRLSIWRRSSDDPVSLYGKHISACAEPFEDTHSNNHRKNNILPEAGRDARERDPEKRLKSSPFSGWIMKNHRTEAHKKEVLFTNIVLRRVLSRFGDWSTQRPTLDKKRIKAMVRTIPCHRNISLTSLWNEVGEQ